MIKFSVITSEIPKMLTKHYELVNGETVKTSGGVMVQGSVKLATVESVEEFAHKLPMLKHNHALCYGIPRGMSVGESKRLTTAQERTPNSLSRTTTDFYWSESPGILFVDHDTGLDKCQFMDIIQGVLPELESIDRVWYPSSSSHIYNGDEQITGLKGQRLYFAVDNASQIPRIGLLIHQRLWLAGHGQIVISASGALLERSPVDATVWQQNRLDFASGAYCVPPLEQRRGEPVFMAGDVRMLRTAEVASLSPSEHQAYKELVDAEKRRKAPEGKRIQTAHIEKRIAGVPKSRIKAMREIYQRAYIGGELMGNFELTVFVEGQQQKVTVEDVLGDIERYHGCQTLDPVEPEYNGNHKTGLLYLRDKTKTLHSFAHGSKTFTLKQQATIEKHTNADRQISEMFSDLQEQEAGNVVTIPLPWQRVSEGTNALRPGTVTILAGPIKAGKSFFTMSIIRAIHEEGHPWACLPLEDDIKAWTWRMLAILEGDYSMTDIGQAGVSARAVAMARRADELRGYIESLTENPRVGVKNSMGETVIPPVGPDDVLKWIKRAAQSARVVIVDPMSQVEFRGAKSWEQEADFIRQACAIVQDSKCSLILVCHTTKGSGTADRSAEHVQGSAMLTRLAHTVLILDAFELDEVDIVRSGGFVEQAEANRVLLIAAARNGAGTRKRMAFLQEQMRPRFHEVGYLNQSKKKGGKR